MAKAAVDAASVTTLASLAHAVVRGELGIVGGFHETLGIFTSVAAARDEALKQMREEAAKLGADAVVGVQITIGGNGKGGQYVHVAGTAVKLDAV